MTKGRNPALFDTRQSWPGGCGGTWPAHGTAALLLATL